MLHVKGYPAAHGVADDEIIPLNAEAADQLPGILQGIQPGPGMVTQQNPIIEENLFTLYMGVYPVKDGRLFSEARNKNQPHKVSLSML